MNEAVQHQLAGEATRLIRERQDEKAIVILDKLIGALPHREDLHASRAYCLGRLGRLDEAYEVCDHLGASSTTPRVQHLRMFLDKQTGVSSTQPKPAVSNEPNVASGPIIEGVPASLAEKLERVRLDIEKEFSQYRARDREATATIQRLRTRSQERDQVFEATQERNDELEKLLGELGTELATFSEVPGLSTSSSRLMNEDFSLTQIPGENAETERLKQDLSERDETLEATFRKNSELERTIAGLKAERDELGEQRDLLEATEDDLRKELHATRSNKGIRGADDIAAVIAALQNALNAAQLRAENLERSRKTITEQLDTLREEMSAGGDSTAATVENERLSVALSDKQRLFETATRSVAELGGKLESAQAEIDQLLARESKITSQVAAIVGELGANMTTVEALQSEKEMLKGKLAGLEAEHRDLRVRHDTQSHSESADADVRDAKFEAASQERIRLEQEIEAIETRFEAIAAKERAARSLVEDLSLEIDAKHIDLEESTSANEQLQQRLTTLREEYETVATRGLELAAEGQAAFGQLEESRQHVDELETKNERLQEKLSETETRLEDIIAQETGTARRTETLEIELVDEREKFDALTLDKAGLTKELTYTRSLLDGAELRKSEALERGKSLEDGLADSAERRKRAEVDNQESNKRIEELEGRIEQLSSEGKATNARIETLDSDLSARNEELEGLRRERSELTEQLDELHTQQKAFAERERAQSTEITRLGTDIEERNAAYTAESEKKSEAELALSHLKMEHAYLGKQESEAQALVEVLTAEIATRDGRIGELEADVERLGGDSQAMGQLVDALEGAGRDSAEKIASVDAELAAARGQIEELKQRRSELEADVARLRIERDEVSKQEAGALEQLDALRNELTDRKNDIGLLTKTGDENEERIEELTQGIIEREARIEKIEGAKIQLTERIAALVGNLVAEKAQLDELGQRRDGLEEDVERLRKELDGVLKREGDALDYIDELRHELADRKNSIVSLTKTRRENEKQIEGLNQGIAAREARLDEVEASKVQLNERIAVLEGELFPLRDRESDARATLDTVEMELQRLHQDSGKTQDALAVAMNRVTDMQAMAVEYESALAAEKEEKGRLEHTAAKLGTNLQELKESKDATAQEALELSEHLAAARVELEGARSKVLELEEELGTFQRDLAAEKEERASLAARSQELEEQLGETQHLLETATTDRGDLEEEKASLSTEFEHLLEKRTAAVSRAEQLSERLSTLDIQLDRANETIAMSSGEILELHTDLKRRDLQLDESRAQASAMEDELDRVKPELEQLYLHDLPEALEQKVSMLRHVQKMKVEIEMLRSQLW